MVKRSKRSLQAAFRSFANQLRVSTMKNAENVPVAVF
nr:MAG TPA: hypothetical protein [Caudoviricetes sp.]